LTLCTAGSAGDASYADYLDDARNWLIGTARAAFRGDRAARPAPLFWPLVTAEAETQGLGPLVDAAIQHRLVDVPSDVSRTFRAQALRETARHRVRTEWLGRILREFDRRSIDVLLLKGCALAWMVYPSPSLRPMADVDVLVPKPAARAAQRTLEALGFEAPVRHRRFGRNAHHLPVASQRVAGMDLHVEIHTDALSRDSGESLAWHSLCEPPRTLSFDATPRATLGHIDTLRHLTHHLLEPSADGRIRLIGVVDLLAYLTIFGDAIDWPRLGRECGFAINVLACVHDVIPLPEHVRPFVPVACQAPSYPSGHVVRPLRSIFERGRSVRDITSELLVPPAWWMHAYYNVAPDEALTRARVLRHPKTVLGWLGLRLRGI
jgi:hypothetical protein